LISLLANLLVRDNFRNHYSWKCQRPTVSETDEIQFITVCIRRDCFDLASFGFRPPNANRIANADGRRTKRANSNTVINEPDFRVPLFETHRIECINMCFATTKRAHRFWHFKIPLSDLSPKLTQGEDAREWFQASPSVRVRLVAKSPRAHVHQSVPHGPRSLQTSRCGTESYRKLFRNKDRFLV
jgi:hypothetical protein